MSTSIPQSPFSRRPAWSVAVIGLPLAILIGGCLGSPRVTSDSINRPAPTAVAGFPASWQPAKPLRKWKSIVLHHTATEAGSVKSIHAAHRKRITNGSLYSQPRPVLFKFFNCRCNCFIDFLFRCGVFEVSTKHLALANFSLYCFISKCKKAFWHL